VRRRFISLPNPSGPVYNFATGDRRMPRKQIGIGRILVSALVVLLLCGIVAGEFPELVSLTDNTTNDFTVVKTKSPISRISVAARSYRQTADTTYKIPVHDVISNRFDRFEHSALIPSDRFTPDSILRT
jgi:hypothetical protein